MVKEQTSQKLNINSSNLKLKAFWTKEETPQLVGFQLNVKKEIVHNYPPYETFKTFTEDVVAICAEDILPLIGTLVILEKDKDCQINLKKRMEEANGSSVGSAHHLASSEGQKE